MTLQEYMNIVNNIRLNNSISYTWIYLKLVKFLIIIYSHCNIYIYYIQCTNLTSCITTNLRHVYKPS